MPPKRARTPDWRDAQAYAPLLDIDRSGFAWEWLRRDPCYVAARGEDAAQWGLHAFEAPEHDVFVARPVWRREAYPYVLVAAAAEEGEDEDRLDLERVARLVTLIRSAGGTEHLLLSDGRHGIRIDIASGSVGAGSVRLSYRLAGLAGAQAPLLVLRQLLALCRTGEFSLGLHAGERRASRWILVLRARDALAAGAGQREIASQLLGMGAACPRWRVEAPSLRSRVQRLVRQARRTAAGGYRDFLALR
jgi:hypothetical protein